jgi:hypothetical protein
MSINIDPAYSQQYAANVQMLLQQKQSRLRMASMSKGYTGKYVQPVQQIGKVELQDWVREGPTPIMNTPHDVRWLQPTTKHGAQLLDPNDSLRTIADFQSSYVANGAAAANRVIDRTIINAMKGTALTGDDHGTSVAWDTWVASNATHLVDSSGTNGMTVSKLREAKRALMAAEVDVDNDPLFVVMTARQHDDLLAETLAVSLDYNDTPVLVDGRITSFMGFNFIHTELLVVDSNSDRRCFAWAQSGLAFGIFDDVTGDISVRNDLGNSLQIYTKVTVGATRTEESKFVEILCDES